MEIYPFFIIIVPVTALLIYVAIVLVPSGSVNDERTQD